MPYVNLLRLRLVHYSNTLPIPQHPKRKAPGRHEDMKLKDWYVVLVVVSLLATFGANELGLGWICFVPSLLVACWLMYEVIRSNKNPPT